MKWIPAAGALNALEALQADADATRDMLGTDQSKVAEFKRNAIEVIRVDAWGSLVQIASWGPHEAPPGKLRMYPESRFECTTDDLPQLIAALQRAQARLVQ